MCFFRSTNTLSQDPEILYPFIDFPTKTLLWQKRTKVAYHTAKIRFESADPSIAVVSNNGTVVGTAKGSTVIYAYAQNGLYAAVKVNVK